MTVMQRILANMEREATEAAQRRLDYLKDCYRANRTWQLERFGADTPSLARWRDLSQGELLEVLTLARDRCRGNHSRREMLNVAVLVERETIERSDRSLPTKSEN